MARDKDGPDQTGLQWTGSPKPVRTGGFVGSVSMNTQIGPKLAVDPNGTVGATTRARELPGGGANVDVQPMTAGQEDVRERKGGRFKMPLG